VNTPVEYDNYDACTEESCDYRTGVWRIDVVCENYNACTHDSCDSEIGCTYTSISCDDYDACTIDDSKYSLSMTPLSKLMIFQSIYSWKEILSTNNTMTPSAGDVCLLYTGYFKEYFG